METLQAQLDAVNAQIAEEQAMGPLRDADVLANLEQKQAVILMKMDDFKAQEEQQAAQQVRIQAQEENKEGLAQFVQDLDLFETFFPKTKFAEIMGLSEYVDQQQLFNQILHQAFVQIEDQRNDKHNADIAERDEKVVALKSVIKQNSDQYDYQLKEMNYDLESKSAEIEQLTEANHKLSTENQTLTSLNETTLAGLKQANEKVDQLSTENEKLKEQVESFKTLSPKPTASIADLLNQAKIKSSVELAMERLTPVRGKIEVVAPPIAPEVSTFQPGDTQTSDYIAHLEQTASEPISAVGPVDSFRLEEVQTVSAPLDGNTVVPKSDAETVTRSEFEALKTVVKELCEICNVDIAEVA